MGRLSQTSGGGTEAPRGNGRVAEVGEGNEERDGGREEDVALESASRVCV